MESVIEEIVSLKIIMGLEVVNNNFDELVKEYRQELTTEGLMELHFVSRKKLL